MFRVFIYVRVDFTFLHGFVRGGGKIQKDLKTFQLFSHGNSRTKSLYTQTSSKPSKEESVSPIKAEPKGKKCEIEFESRTHDVNIGVNDDALSAAHDTKYVFDFVVSRGHIAHNGFLK